MINPFRNIRLSLPSEMRTGKYLKYAIGEIFLVVIGILIAVNINNWNENRKTRTIEVNYLRNIQADLNTELKNNDSYIKEHNQKAILGYNLMTTPVGKTKSEQLNLDMKRHYVHGWKNFIPTNNTFKELISSGQLNSISSDSIKYYLLEIDKIYASIANSEHHMRREYEKYLYDISVPNTALFNNINFDETLTTKMISTTDSSQISDNQFLKMQEDFIWLRNNQTYQNGLKLAVLNNLYINTRHQLLTVNINRLNRLISEEIKKN
ncbi:MAG: hypothetical protein HQ521_14155 [Bacteroidetes bacterium]|nr:hypothetical protein [Bacteroidota bacterium]